MNEIDTTKKPLLDNLEFQVRLNSVLTLQLSIPGVHPFCNLLTEHLVLLAMDTGVHLVWVVVA